MLDGKDDPAEIVACGDLHGNTKSAVAMVHHAGKLLRAEKNRVILQAGDFGIWPNGYGYLDAVNEALSEEDIELWFAEGNHEDFSQLPLSKPNTSKIQMDQCAAGESSKIYWLPRGHRWEWHGRTWLALGGAASVDKAMREEGISWWPEEEITNRQADRVIADGPADVMLTHDCPAGPVFSYPPPPPQWDVRDLARSEIHRERLRHVVDAVKPGHLIHGHMHIPVQRLYDFGYGDVQVTGLDKDGEPWNYAVLNLETMEWHD